MMLHPRNLFYCLLASVAVAFLLFLVCGVSFPVLDHYVHSLVKRNVVLKEGGALFKAWVGNESSPAGVTEVYLFDIRNAIEIVERGEKPVLVQRGPYVYTNYLHKFNLTFHNNDTVSFREQKRLVFDPEKSVGSESDLITSISIPLITLLSLIHEDIPFFGDFLKYVVKEDIFITHTVHELLWGYNDSLLHFVHEFNHSLVPDTIVGVFYGQNNSNDGLFNVHTGADDIKKIGIVDRWNGHREMDVWSTKYANMINGTDGSLAPPFHVVNKYYKLRMFSKDICRSIYMTYESQVKHSGIKALRFSPPECEFANATENPDNAGFCVPPGHCLGSGLIDSSTCTVIGGLPIPLVASNPHFLYADSRYGDAVIGLNTQQPGLTTQFDVEPLSGLVVEANKRIQLNINVNNSAAVTRANNIGGPIFVQHNCAENRGMQFSASLDTEPSVMIRKQLNAISAAHLAQFTFLSLAALILLISVVVWAIYKDPHQSDNASSQSLLDEEPEEE